MLPITILQPVQFIAFFEKHGIPLDGGRVFSRKQIDRIFSDAFKFNLELSLFILKGIFGNKEDGYSAIFDSYDEAYNCYISFITGLSKDMGMGNVKAN